MFDFIIENKKLVIFLFVVAIIITLVVIWWPNNKGLGYYEELSDEEINQRAAKLYGNQLQLALYSQDTDFLNKYVSAEYLEYNAINQNEYRSWLSRNQILTSNIKFIDTVKYEYGSKNIFVIDAVISGVSRKINIIESSPEKWEYAFDTFVNFESDAITKDYGEYGVIINNIYQDINYIEFDCSLYVDDKQNQNVDIAKSDSIVLEMDDDNSMIMTTNNFTSEYIVIDGKKYYNLKCIFNVPIDNQKKIYSISFHTFNIDGNDKSINVNLFF